MGQVQDVVEPSAPEMEEQRFDKQVGVEALPMQEASAPPWLKPHLVESLKENKDSATAGEVQPPPQVVERSVLCFCPQAQAMKVQKEIQSASRRKGPMKVTRTQMWVDLIKAGADRKKLDGKSNRHLLEL